MEKLELSEEEWEEKLTKKQYRILRDKGTEIPFTGRLWNHKEKGIYRCAGCGNKLFVSDTKFKSGCGWPSFFEPVNEESVEYHEDKTLGMTRTEVTCAKCGGHLGHVFDDGPEPTGKRYCINSGAMEFEKR